MVFSQQEKYIQKDKLYYANNITEDRILKKN